MMSELNDDAKPRFMFPAQVMEKFNLTQTDMLTITRSHYPDAPKDTVLILLAIYAQHNIPWRENLIELMPFKKDGVKTYQVVLGLKWWRYKAQSSGKWMGIKPAEFGAAETRTYKTQYDGEKEVRVYDWAQVTVLKMMNGEVCEFAGPRVHWDEYVKSYKGVVQQTHWQKPRFFLEKTAEVAALRRVFGFDEQDEDVMIDAAALSVSAHLDNQATSKEGAVDDVRKAVGDDNPETETPAPQKKVAKKKVAKKVAAKKPPPPPVDDEEENHGNPVGEEEPDNAPDGEQESGEVPDAPWLD